MAPLVPSDCRPAFQQVIDRPGELVGQDGQGLALPVFFLSVGQRLLARRIGAEAQERRFGEGPLERRMADLRAGGPRALPGRCLGALDHAAIGHTILDPWEASAVRLFIEEHESEELANARARLEQVQCVRLMLLGRCDHGPLQVPQPLVLRVEQGEVHLTAVWARRSGKPLGAPSAVRLVRDLWPALGHVGLPVGLLDMRQEFRTFAPQVWTAAPPSTGRAHLRRIAIGLWHHAAAPEGGHLGRSTLRVFRLATVESLPRARVAQDAGEALCSAEVGAPIPGAETFYGAPETLSRGGNRLEEWFWSRLPGTVEPPCALVAHDADGHTPGMEGDPAVQRVLVGVASPGGLLLMRA
jgi:hypothetical protein